MLDRSVTIPSSAGRETSKFGLSKNNFYKKFLYKSQNNTNNNNLLDINPAQKDGP